MNRRSFIPALAAVAASPLALAKLPTIPTPGPSCQYFRLEWGTPWSPPDCPDRLKASFVVGVVYYCVSNDGAELPIARLSNGRLESFWERDYGYGEHL